MTTLRYDFDSTGLLPDNKIKDELHVLSVGNGSDYQFIIARAAPFFQNSIEVFHIPSQRTLTQGVDYILTHRYREASDEVGTGIYGSVTFLDKDLSGQVRLNYQTLGGEFVLNEPLILSTVIGDLSGHRVIDWADIANTPATFPPVYHKHQEVDVGSFQELVSEVKAINDTLKGEGHVNHQHRIAQIQGLDVALASKIDNTGQHRVRLGEVFNYPNRHTGTLTITLPELDNSGLASISILVQDRYNSHTMRVSGDLLASTDATFGSSVSNAKLSTSIDSPSEHGYFAYNEQGQAVIYIGDIGVEWDQPTLVINEVLCSELLKDDFNKAISFGQAASGLGERFKVNRPGTSAEINNRVYEFDAQKVFRIRQGELKVNHQHGQTSNTLYPLFVHDNPEDGHYRIEATVHFIGNPTKQSDSDPRVNPTGGTIRVKVVGTGSGNPNPHGDSHPGGRKFCNVYIENHTGYPVKVEVFKETELTTLALVVGDANNPTLDYPMTMEVSVQGVKNFTWNGGELNRDYTAIDQSALAGKIIFSAPANSDTTPHALHILEDLTVKGVNVGQQIVDYDQELIAIKAALGQSSEDISNLLGGLRITDTGAYAELGDNALVRAASDDSATTHATLGVKKEGSTPGAYVQLRNNTLTYRQEVSQKFSGGTFSQPMYHTYANVSGSDRLVSYHNQDSVYNALHGINTHKLTLGKDSEGIHTGTTFVQEGLTGNSGSFHQLVGTDVNNGFGLAWFTKNPPSGWTSVSQDTATFYRRKNGITHVVFEYTLDTNDIVFNGEISVGGLNVYQTLQALSNSSTSADGRLTTLNQSVTKLRQDVDSNDSDISALQQRVTATEQANSTQGNSLQSHSGRLDLIEQEQQSLTTDIANNKSSITATNNALGSTNSNVSQNARDITSLEQDLANTKQNVSTNASSISQLNTGQTQQNNRLTALENEDSSLSQRITSNTSSINTLSSNLTKAEGDIEDNVDGIKAINTSISQIKQVNTNQDSQLNNFNSQLNSLNQSINDLNNSDTTQNQAIAKRLEVNGGVATINEANGTRFELTSTNGNSINRAYLGNAYGTNYASAIVALYRDSVNGAGYTFRGDSGAAVPGTVGAMAFWRLQGGTYSEVFRYLYTSNNVFFSGEVFSNIDFTVTSDKNFKSNIRKLDLSLEMLDLIDAYTFNRTDIDDPKMDFAGVIAQEFKKVLPQSVRSDEDGKLRVSPLGVDAFVIAMLKGLKAELEEIKAKL
ncbi:tail fiber domain-containing protein [Endozoicomonas sp. ONNA1]|uniref:tail fiber domain-containing protein n=1 Tax=Endozoicomonas sp. ONNA1 TaxID=2828740 RepID=UPI00214885ED|nr:tail fiber domain-containing protein [Endozoicomonas sp. ONNA1]